MDRTGKNSQSTIADAKSAQERFERSTLFYPIAKMLLDKYKPSTDIISTFEAALENIEGILSGQSILDEFIYTKVEGMVVKVKYWVDNIQFHSPNSAEFIARSNKYMNANSPNQAFEQRKTYSVLATGDVHCLFTPMDIIKEVQFQPKQIDLDRAYAVNIPMPVGCKYDPMNYYDPISLIKTGESMEGFKGTFIVGGFPKNLQAVLKKPFNQPMIQHNEYDNQKSRMECLYSAGLDYENSHYIIMSMLSPKISARGQKKIPIADFIVSMQMDDPRMNKEKIVSRKKVLINAVPIKYVFYAFGCQNDKEMLRYICPDMDNFGLLNTIKDACLYGDKHVKCLDGIIDYTTTFGPIQFDEPLTMFVARYIIGEIILNDEYKRKLKANFKNDIAKYKTQVVTDVDKILREKFMPGINRINSDMSLYNKAELTEEEADKLIQQEKERNKAICFKIGQIVKDLYNIGNDIQPSMDKVSLTNKRVRLGQQLEYEFKGFNNSRIRETKIDIEQFFKTVEDKNYFKEKRFEDAFRNHLMSVVKRTNEQQSGSLLNSFKNVVTKEKSKLRTQLLTPKNQVFVDSMIREIVIGADKGLQSGHDDIQWEHRVVHPSHLYFIDPCYTPEGGKSVGKNQQPTLFTYLTNGDLGLSVVNYIKKLPQYKPYVETLNTNYSIELNGSTIGYVAEYEDVEEMYDQLMKARQTEEIVPDCSIILDNLKGVLGIWTDEGRMMNHFVNVKNCFNIKPMSIESKKLVDQNVQGIFLDSIIDIKPEFKDWLIRCQKCDVDPIKKVEKQKGGGFKEVTAEYIEKIKNNGLPQLISDVLYKEGLRKGFLTLLDPTMAIANATIAPRIDDFYASPYRYNYIALPEQTLSYVSAINPSVALNAGVRTSYCSNHVKQAIGPTLRYPEMKYINEMNILCAPQIPLVRPCIYDYLHYDQKPMGNNIIIAFLMYTENQEDSFIFNRESVENGVLCIDSLYTYFSTTTKKLDEAFKLPGDDIIKSGNVKAYSKLDANSCLPTSVGQRFYNGDPLIAKSVKVNQNGKTTDADKSVLNEKPDARHPLEACTRELRYVFNNENINKNTTEKMATFKQRRVPISGDKFNSTNAQKGTLGKIYDTQNMPYTESGIVPDIIFNPPSIFKRNTCGQIYEPSIAKIAAMLGCSIDTSPYSTYRHEKEIDYLYEQLGISIDGCENLYDAESGRLMGKVFVSTLQQQRQQHLVENKLNIRGGVGDCDKISGLPVKGRKRSGGQSVDRMSNDAINTSGAVLLNRNIHLEQGAKKLTSYCKHCHAEFTYISSDFKCWFCANCGRHQDFLVTEVPPIQPLINQIFNGLHFGIDLKEVNDLNDEDKGILSTIEEDYYSSNF